MIKNERKKLTISQENQATVEWLLRRLTGLSWGPTRTLTLYPSFSSKWFEENLIQSDVSNDHSLKHVGINPVHSISKREAATKWPPVLSQKENLQDLIQVDRRIRA